MNQAVNSSSHPDPRATGTQQLHKAKEFLQLFVPVAILIVTGTWTLIESEINADSATLLAEEKTYVELGISRLEKELAIPIRHLLSLANEAPVREVYQSQDRSNLDSMEQAFISLLSRNLNYDQVRWLDEHGMERVRVDNHNGELIVAANDQLQDKHNRYYFADTMQLTPGVVYISPLDLNTENGKIEEPYKPTIRVSVKVYDTQERPRGLLIINVSANYMLDSFVASAGPAGSRLMLLNEKGYWLKSPNSADEWGFMFGRELTLSAQNPQLWKEITVNHSGHRRFADGLWTWQRFSLQPGKTIPLARNVRWTVLSHIPEKPLSLAERQIRQDKILIASVILLLFGLGIRRLVQIKAAHIQAEKDAALARNEAQATRRLQEAQASFKMLFEANTSALIVTDDNGRIALVNPAFESMFGHPVSAVLGQPLEMLLPESIRPQHAKLRAAYMRAPTNRAMGAGRELFGIRRTGEEFPIEVGLSPYRDNNKLFVLATVVDISDRKRAQDRILQMNETLEKRVAERTKELQLAQQEAQHLASIKGNFLANMSHEIRTPMNAILGLAYLLEKADLEPNELDLVKKIRVAGRSLLSIINDILDFSKIESGRLEIEHAPFRLNDVLDNVATLMSAVEQKNDVELSMGPAPKGMELLRGDALRIEQVLVNLTTNALKFTQKGSVVITVDKLPAQDDQDRLRFSVKDTGKGIEPDKLTEIFDSFAQEDSSTSRRFGGTGLGLSICRRLVEIMGGRIGVVSEPGKGSEFWFILPLEKVESQDYVQPSMAFQNVLIADDHPVAREMLSATVRSLGWNPETVSSGEEAVDRFMQRALNDKLPDIVLLDWYMPGMGGLNAGTRIKNSLGDMPGPIIVMATAYDRDGLIHHRGAEIADAILTKPVTASHLYNAISEAKRQRHGQPALQMHSPHDTDDGRLEQLHILVVDDSEINRDMAKRILESEGAVVELADDGLTALEHLKHQQKPVDVVLMDVQMPSMDGYETTRQIREVLGLESLPVIALTAGAFKNQQAAALAAGMNGFVAKPFDVDELIMLLQQCAAKTAPLSLSDSAPSPVGTSSSNLIIDVKRGLKSWGNAETYYKYLRKFAQAHGRDGDEIDALISADRLNEANAFTHKLKGTASNLAIITVWDLAEKLESALCAGNAAGDLPKALQSALDSALQEIANLVAPFTTKEATILAVTDNEVVLQLLDDLLNTLDSDNPDKAEPSLQALEKILTEQQLKPIREMLDSFDFRAAETEARILIEQYHHE